MANVDNESVGRWIPLESNPEVFNLWAKKAGLVTSQAHFTDVYGFDCELLEMVPPPVKAVILLFPIDPEGDARRQAEDERLAKEGQPKIDNTIFFIKQTIGNACGTIGLIHALANSNVEFTPMSPLQKFIIDCQDKTPLERASLLANTPLFANIHAESASSGQTAAPDNGHTDLHFTCFIEAPDADVRGIAQGNLSPDKVDGKQGTGMRLVELDGRRAGPIDHGECQDLLQDAAELIKARYVSSAKSIHFSLMALSGTPDEDY